MNRSGSSVSCGDHGFIETLFSWSLEDIFNGELYRNKMKGIDNSFGAVEDYFESFTYPLLDETRAQLCSSMNILSRLPFAEVISLDEAQSQSHDRSVYTIKTGSWKNRSYSHGKELYKTLFGDIFILSEFKPATVNDLQRSESRWSFVGILEEEIEDDELVSTFKVIASKGTDLNKLGQKSLFIIFLRNIIPNRRIWSALHMQRDSKLIKKILCDVDVAGAEVEESCDHCSLETDALRDDGTYQRLSSELDEDQYKATCDCLSSLRCLHNSTVNLIRGPPGTGKTKTLGTLLFALLKMKRRTLACAPKNVAIKEVASRVLSMVRDTKSADALFCELGDMLLVGNHEQRLKVGADIEDIDLDYRVKQLSMCFTSPTGWRRCFGLMTDLLLNCVSQYDIELKMEQDQIDDNDPDDREKGGDNPSDCSVRMPKSFLEFVRERFRSLALPLKNCISVLCTHIARSCIHNFEDLARLIHSFDSFEALLFQSNITVSKELFPPPEKPHSSFEPAELGDGYLLYKTRTEFLSLLATLQVSLAKLDLQDFPSEESIRDFCLRTSSIIFCTASSSFELHSVAMQESLNCLVIDEANQLKECESIIPLLLPDINHAILVGDECQLPAMVASSVSLDVGFGRSLFERLSSLGHHPIHLLNTQYRMHPSISSFPNSRFYMNQIRDAPYVTTENYRKQYLQGIMFGTYSFINIVGGLEEFDDGGRSPKNMVEVAVVLKIVKSCFQAWLYTKENLSIGIVSPCAAQVVAIQDKLGQKYEKHNGFDVKVETIDEGREKDIVILSTVRTDCSSSSGFISDNCKKTNVALTRARHCLWIVGSEVALVSREKEVWKDLVKDAKTRQCFFNANEDKDLAKVIWNAKQELNQFDDLLNPESRLFKDSKWKVFFSDNFLSSFKNLQSNQIQKSVISLLIKISSGWRPKSNKDKLHCGNSSNMLRQYKVEGHLIICSRDIIKEWNYLQVIKIWDILPQEDLRIAELVKHLDGIFRSYTDDFISRCTKRHLISNEDLEEVPMSWERSTEIVKYEASSCDQSRVYLENAKVDESLILMKFYSLSSVVVRHLLSDRDTDQMDFPLEVSDEERDIILYDASTFVLGRSGTGKTTVLTSKLFQKEESHHKTVKETFGVKSAATVPFLNHDEECEDPSIVKDRALLRQLFVTVSPKLCHAVRQHVVRLKRFICGDNISPESRSVEEDTVDVDTSIQFKNIPDSFINLPANSYPLVITFQKFLMMLDGTVGNSYFDRFSDLSSGSQDLGVRSFALETFIRKKEVTYDRFDSLYWPRFNSRDTKKLDSSRVFTEIISHIKGGMQAVESKLSRKDYLSLSEKRGSSLSKKQREIIYDNIYQSYEKMKMEKGEFDLADIVADLHHRLRINKYEGDEIHFVYIDEVQDLTMSQIALFKYVCQNVEDGFIFSGDTAQTIAKEIDFRCEDIRTLFYTEFVQKSKKIIVGQGKKKEGKMSDIFVLNQNFRTHSGVLKLSQSIIEVLSHFFPHSIDVLKPETSLISGEAPVVLTCSNRTNTIATIFVNNGDLDGKFVGFGASQVILVRDESARKDILEHIGNQAVVLTILECKGLEFRDVFLWNFFGSSPLKNGWRVIYEYMHANNMVESTKSKSYPTFDDAKHSILCSELKQLYVAITRTRQRLWLSENTEEFCGPAFDYWEKKGLIQFKELDNSVIEAMKVTSTPEEWKSRGKELYYQNNYEMATMCFERAGDSHWERKSKAAGLRVNAGRLQLQGSDAKEANAIFIEAAEIFEGIGMTDSAAQCYSESGDHERAGRLYLEKCEEPYLKRAGYCFDLAGNYEAAAKVYARGRFFSDCLTVCTKGGLLDIGLRYIQDWKQNGNEKSLDLDTIEHEFLLSVSLPIAADHMGKVGRHEEAYELMLANALANSLWSAGSKGWPLKSFAQKTEFLEKALLFAKQVSARFSEIASMEAEILSCEDGEVFEIMNHLKASRMNESIRGETLCLRKLMDSHFKLSSKDVRRDYMFDDPVEEKIEKNQLSVQTMFYCWRCWKDSIVHVLEYLSNLKSHHQPGSYAKFGFNYLGVEKLDGGYLLLIPDASWLKMKNLDDRLLERKGKRVFIDFQTAINVAQTYWTSELFFVSKQVRATISELHTGEPTTSSYLLLYFLCIYEVMKFLNEYKRFSYRHGHGELGDKERLVTCQETITELCFKVMYPLGWSDPDLTRNLIFVRTRDAYQELMEHGICLQIEGRDQPSCDYIVWSVAVVLGTSKVKNGVCEKIIKKSEYHKSWKDFLQTLISAEEEVKCFSKLYEALRYTWSCFWRYDYTGMTFYRSPDSLMYLTERLLLLTSLWSGVIFTAKSSFLEWLIYQDEQSLSNLSFMANTGPNLEEVYGFISEVVQRSTIGPYFTQNLSFQAYDDGTKYLPILMQRLVALACLLYLISGNHLELLHKLLEKSFVTRELPDKFLKVLRKGKRVMDIKVIAEAFKAIDNPLVIVRLRNNYSTIVCPDAAVFVDLMTCQQRESILQKLFPDRVVEEAYGSTSKESDPSQANTAAGNDDQGQNVSEESKDTTSKNSQGATSSGHGNITENKKGKRNKSKKNKGGKKGRK